MHLDRSAKYLSSRGWLLPCTYKWKPLLATVIPRHVGVFRSSNPCHPPPPPPPTAVQPRSDGRWWASETVRRHCPSTTAGRPAGGHTEAWPSTADRRGALQSAPDPTAPAAAPADAATTPPAAAAAATTTTTAATATAALRWVIGDVLNKGVVVAHFI